VTRESLLGLDCALDAAQSALEHIPYPASLDFINLATEISYARTMVANKLDALTARRHTAS
jgi:hypothetical protein